MDLKPNKTSVRVMRRLKRFKKYGLEPVCACGETDVFALEIHHEPGRNHDSLAVVRCKSCHAKETEAHRREEIGRRYEPNDCKRVILCLKGLIVFFEMLIPALRRWIEWLERSL